MAYNKESDAIPKVYNELERAISSWRKQDQIEYLKSLKSTVYGSKEELTARIMTLVPIGDAVTITRKYRQMVQRQMEGGEEELKEEAAEIEITDVEMTNLAIALKRKQESKPTTKAKTRHVFQLTPPLTPPGRCQVLLRTETPR